MARVLARICFIILALCSHILCHDYKELDCYEPTSKNSFEKISRGEYLTSHSIDTLRGKKNDKSCLRTTLTNISSNVAFGHVEYTENNRHISYNKTLTRNDDGTVVEDYDGLLSPYHIVALRNGLIFAVQCLPNDRFIHLSYPANRPELFRISAHLAKQYVRHPERFVVRQARCSYENFSVPDKMENGTSTVD